MDDAVKGTVLIAESALASAQLVEVLSSFGDDIVVELEGDAATVAVSDGNVEVDVSSLGHNIL